MQVCPSCAKSHKLKIVGTTGSWSKIKCEICKEKLASLLVKKC
jgi:hypothetical protein